MSVSCSPVVPCWEMTDLLALLYVMFSSAFYTFPYSVLGPVWYLIVSIPDLCLLPYFVLKKKQEKKTMHEPTHAHNIHRHIEIKMGP